MKNTLTEKILAAHLVSGGTVPQQPLAIRVDDTLTQDALGTVTWLQFEAQDVPQVKTRAVSFIDHNTVQLGFENADDHNYLQSVAEKYGGTLSKAGNGICHQVFLERFAAPGRVLIGSDSHTPTAGGMGVIAIGTGGLDVALTMAGHPYEIKTPQVIGAHLTGQLSDWVTAKDVILTILQKFGTKNTYKIFEYFGEGVSTLSIPERATITNMGAELGVTTSIFPSDTRTLEFLTLVGREEDYQALSASEGAQHDEIFDLNLSEVVPMVSLAPKPGQRGLGEIVPLVEALNIKAHQVCVGACTNSSYHDLMIVAESLRERHVHKNVELVVTPGSRAVKQLMVSTGGYSLLNQAGARITEEVCGACVGQGYSPRSGGVRVATFNRNFCGRSGTPDDQSYLVSPEAAVAAAVTGTLSDPREVFANLTYKRFTPPTYPRIDALFIFNQASPETEIIRGPNIKSVPVNTPPPSTLQSVVTIKLRDKITTDDITPAGRWLKYRSNIPEYARATFSGIDPGFYQRASEIRDGGETNLIVAGGGYGKGSSREHAALAPLYLGVKAVITKSFERIHRTNLINVGIFPFEFENPNDYTALETNDRILIRALKDYLEQARSLFTLQNLTTDTTLTLRLEVSPRERAILLAGGALRYYSQRERPSQVRPDTRSDLVPMSSG